MRSGYSQIQLDLGFEPKWRAAIQMSKRLRSIQDICARACQMCAMRGPWVGNFPQCSDCRSIEGAAAPSPRALNRRAASQTTERSPVPSRRVQRLCLVRAIARPSGRRAGARDIRYPFSRFPQGGKRPQAGAEPRRKKLPLGLGRWRLPSLRCRPHLRLLHFRHRTRWRL